MGEYQKGRPARRFELRADAAVVVGVDVGPDHILTAVADLRGEILAREHTDTDLDHDSPDERRAAATSAVDDALRGGGASRATTSSPCARRFRRPSTPSAPHPRIATVSGVA